MSLDVSDASLSRPSALSMTEDHEGLRSSRGGLGGGFDGGVTDGPKFKSVDATMAVAVEVADSFDVVEKKFKLLLAHRLRRLHGRHLARRKRYKLMVEPEIRRRRRRRPASI